MNLSNPSAVVVVYGELYGGKITGSSKQYTGSQKVGFRLFDVRHIERYAEVLTWPIEAISAWRESGSGDFVSETALQQIAAQADLPIVPRLLTLSADTLPTTLDAMVAFLQEHLPTTQVALDENAGGRAEGIVLRTPDRSVIAKARLEDYERTLKRRVKQGKP